MVFPRDNGDLYHKYRPKKFSEVVGHQEVINSIKNALIAKSPSQAYLLTGDSGCGKTTTARIMALSLNCDNREEDGEPCLECLSCKSILSGRCMDIVEVNAADDRGIDFARTLCSTMHLMPMQVKRKVFILDEFHQTTNSAQSSFLKELEEAPKHVFIILCTTHPAKIIPTVKNRCQKFTFNSLPPKQIIDLLEQVSTFEGFDFDNTILKSIAQKSEGSPRNALVLLQQVSQLDNASSINVEKLLSSESEVEGNAIKICLHLSGSNPRWATLMELYNDAIHMGAPAVGMIIAGFFRNKLIASKTPTEASINSTRLSYFVNVFPEGKLGENNLVLNLYKAYAMK